MFIYFFIIRIVSLWNQKARKLVKGQKVALAELRKRVSPGRWYWFHAASVGEFEQGRPVIERIRREHPDIRILLTFFSPSGFELRKDYKGADIVTYLPFATRRNARRLLDIVSPEKVFFIKYEFWPAYLRQLKKRNIPTYSLASVFRKNQFFFRPLVGKPYLRLLCCFTKLLVQDEASRKLLAKYSIENVSVTGDPRFNRVAEIAAHSQEIPMVDRFTQGMPENQTAADNALGGSRGKILVAGSTWPQDEEMLANYINTHEDVRLVLVPHEIDEKHMQKIFRIFEGRFVRLTQTNLKSVDTCRVLVVDAMGMLASIYRYATVAYIGGGFGVGIHNTLEAAVYGIPVVWGKNYKRFREAQGLIEGGGGFAVGNYKELESVLDNAFLHSKEIGQKSREYVLSETNAVDLIIKELTN